MLLYSSGCVLLHGIASKGRWVGDVQRKRATKTERGLWFASGVKWRTRLGKKDGAPNLPYARVGWLCFAGALLDVSAQRYLFCEFVE